jgi:putative intracellular protease/amidase
MGSGASAGVAAAAKVASDEDLKSALSKLSAEDKAKLLQALESANGSKPAGKKVLIVSTSADKLGEHATGAWSEEICGPYYVFKDAGCDVTVCSIAGGDIPIDAGSLSDTFKTENDKRMIDEGCKPMKGTAKLADFDVTTFDIVFFAGGHGTCVDFCTDAVGEVLAKAVTAGKVVAAVCHGPMALANAKKDGEPVVKGKKVACFTNEEEGMVGLTEKVPFLLETKMKDLGAIVSPGAAWSDTALADGKLVTGQNPQSSVSCAKLALAA